MQIIKSIVLFILAGICEIGGGYLIWRWLKEGMSWKYAILGAVILVLYGVIAAMQPSSFGRVYATYGGFFIVLSIIWAYYFDGFIPDKYDIIGAVVCLVGVGIIYYAPR